ncbi:MAG: hypothetical protein ACJ8EM_01430 [Sphingomicrobium sp.]
MKQDPARPASGADGKPRFLTGINGVIAGLTGLVVATGGLVTAYKAITDDKPAEQPQQQQALAEQPAQPAAAPKEEQPPARPVLFRGDLYDDGKYEGGSVEIEQQGDKWIVNETGNKYEYDEIASRDQSQIVAYSADYGSTLRWPVKGGVVEESEKDRRDVWKTYAKVAPRD